MFFYLGDNEPYSLYTVDNGECLHVDENNQLLMSRQDDCLKLKEREENGRYFSYTNKTGHENCIIVEQKNGMKPYPRLYSNNSNKLRNRFGVEMLKIMNKMNNNLTLQFTFSEGSQMTYVKCMGVTY